MIFGILIRSTALQVTKPNMKLPLLLACLFAAFTANAQNKADITGMYMPAQNYAPEGNAHLFVLRDGSYVIPYFGGVQVGKWAIGANDRVTFTPSYYPYSFALWGRHNKVTGDSTRIYFSHFEEGGNFIALKTAHEAVPVLQRVFNTDANCVPYPSVHKFAGMPDTLLLSNMPANDDGNDVAEVYSFPNPERYNDFLLYYFKPDAEHRPFYATIREGQLNFDRDEFAKNQPLPGEGEDLEFITEMSKMAGRDLPDTMLINPYYKDCDEDVLDTLNFRYDVAKNAFINFLNYEEGEEYTQPQDYYNRCFILYPFRKLGHFIRDRRTITITETPLFQATCGEE